MNMHEHITRSLADCGFATIEVGDPAGHFAYTIGFTELGHPEILMCGARGKVAHQLFWDLYRSIKAGKRYNSGDIDTELGNLPTAFRTVNPDVTEDFCFQAVHWYKGTGKTPTFLQLVMPDPAGLLPWQEGYDSKLMRPQRQLWVNLH